MSNQLFPKIENPGAVELRKFGLISAVLVSLIFAFFLPWVFSHAIPQWPFIVSAILVVWALVLPSTLYVVYLPWMKIGAVLDFINTRIILGIVFYLLITPAGFVARLFGSATIKSHDTDELSFRIESNKPTAEHMERPF